jgi:hypothetical protein
MKDDKDKIRHDIGKRYHVTVNGVVHTCHDKKVDAKNDCTELNKKAEEMGLKSRYEVVDTQA